MSRPSSQATSDRWAPCQARGWQPTWNQGWTKDQLNTPKPQGGLRHALLNWKMELRPCVLKGVVGCYS